MDRIYRVCNVYEDRPDNVICYADYASVAEYIASLIEANGGKCMVVSPEEATALGWWHSIENGVYI